MSYKHVPTETYGTSLDILEQLLMHSDHLAKLSQQYIILEYEDKHRNRAGNVNEIHYFRSCGFLEILRK